MPALKKHLPTYRFLAVIIHLAVYLPFFAVQFLYNFDIATHANAGVSLKVSFNHRTIGAETSHKLNAGNAQLPVKAKVRLNKRFQPESIIVFDSYHSTPVVEWLTLLKPSPVNTKLNSSLVSFSQPLRGPPQIV